MTPIDFCHYVKVTMTLNPTLVTIEKKAKKMFLKLGSYIARG